MERAELLDGVEAQLAAASTGTVLDAGRLHDLEAQLGDAGFVDETVRLYVRELPGRIAALSKAAAGADADAVRTTAHALKSASGMLGAVALQSACAGLEAAAPRATGAEITARVREVVRLAVRTRDEMTAFVDGRA